MDFIVCKIFGEGNYIVIFEYDTSKYVLTDYKKEGVEEDKSSKAINKELTIGGITKQVTATDLINLKTDNIANINLGLKEAKIFDLKLSKYIDRVIVENKKETTVYSYKNTNFAKIEIPANLVNDTTITVEYKITILNEGEVEGYASSIVDYVSKEYNFDSKLNPNWYISDDKLYNTSLENEKILPGEEKTITLKLTKKLNDNNLGLISNTAEIAKSYNEIGLVDIDSIANNNLEEDDLGQADLIISVKTGKTLIIVLILAIILIIILCFTIKIKKFIKTKNN